MNNKKLNVFRKKQQATSDPSKLFNKRFSFAPAAETLPNDIYTSEKWEIIFLQKRKDALNAVKCKLDKFDLNLWSQHTKRRDPSTNVLRVLRQKFQPELITQAWCKFYECLNQLPIIPASAIAGNQLRSLHLCEAPGGFVAALNHFLALNHPSVKLDWMASSLNPNYEGNNLNRMVADDRLISRTPEHWNFGKDNTGDITKYYNHQHLVKNTDEVFLVTADGSINCMLNPGEQEREVEFLLYCETMTALAVLQTGGSFVLKLFTMFEESTICLLFLLRAAFGHVDIFKPCTSKGGNGEVYAICRKYRGFDFLASKWDALLIPYNAGAFEHSMFSRTDINSKFVDQISRCSKLFMDYQVVVIEGNIKDFQADNPENVYKRNNVISKYFLTYEYFLDKIPNEKRLVRAENINTYPNRATEFDCDRKVFVNKCGLHLKFSVGRKFTDICYSNFCAGDKLRSVATFFGTTSKPLADKLLKRLAVNSSVINYYDFHDAENFHDFQMKLFASVKSCLMKKKYIIFNRVPFITHFTVGLLYILSVSYQRMTFCRNGVILLELHDSNNDLIVDYFNKIANKIKSVENTSFDTSILGIVDSKYIRENDFFECVWFYNTCNVYSTDENRTEL